ncbi:MAG: hypothetical protein IJ641_09125 [Lachnospiraceae bacterium]|nr:hypothetical protein [Lachnospiraceae bacterium]
MDIEFKVNPNTGTVEAWQDGRVIGEFVTTGMLVKGWKLTDCLIRKEQRLCSDQRRRNMM